MHSLHQRGRAIDYTLLNSYCTKIRVFFLLNDSISLHKIGLPTLCSTGSGKGENADNLVSYNHCIQNHNTLPVVIVSEMVYNFDFVISLASMSNHLCSHFTNRIFFSFDQNINYVVSVTTSFCSYSC
jgi:hypothetical protein